MDWKTFSATIVKSELFSNTTDNKIIMMLFKRAGSAEEFSLDAAKKWCSKKRTAKSDTYFPEGKLNDVSGAFAFFRKRSDSKLKTLQELFREVGDDESPINLETNDLDIFCMSLVNQFEDLLGLEKSDISDIMISSCNKPVTYENVDTDTDSSKNIICDKELVKLFKEIAEYCKINDLINRDPSLIYFRNREIDYDLLSLADRFVEDVRSNILTLFEPYKKELTYIQISQFVILVSEYKEYLRDNWHNATFYDTTNSIFEENFSISNLKSEFDTRTEGYRKQLEHLYNEIIMK